MRGFWTIKYAARAVEKRFRVPKLSRLDGSRRAEPAVVVAIYLTVPLKAGEPKIIADTQQRRSEHANYNGFHKFCKLCSRGFMFRGEVKCAVSTKRTSLMLNQLIAHQQEETDHDTRIEGHCARNTRGRTPA